MHGPPEMYRPRAPTVREASDQVHAGPGGTEATFMGSGGRNPTAENNAIHEVSIEQSLIGEIRAPISRRRRGRKSQSSLTSTMN